MLISSKKIVFKEKKKKESDVLEPPSLKARLLFFIGRIKKSLVAAPSVKRTGLSHASKHLYK